MSNLETRNIDPPFHPEDIPSSTTSFPIYRLNAQTDKSLQTRPSPHGIVSADTAPRNPEGARRGPTAV